MSHIVQSIDATLHPRDSLPLPRLGVMYVLCVPFFAAIAAMRGEGLSIAGFNYTGFLWVSALIVGGLLLLVERGLRPEHRVYFRTAPWVAWLALVGASFIWLDEPGLPQAREAAQLCMPVLVGTLASLFVRSRERLAQLVRALYYALPVLWLFIAIWAFSDLDEALRSDVYVEKRALALTAVIIGGLYIAGTERNGWLAWFGWAVCLAVSVVTGSRMATMAILLLPILNPVTRNPLRKAAAIAAIGVLALAVYFTPIFQERFFQGESGGVDKIAQGEFDSAGRFEAWPLILEEALRRPWLGHGVGTVQRFVPEVWDGVSHPHNDYLRVGYELGGVGLTMFLGVMFWQLWSLGRLVRRTDGVVQQAFAGAWLGLAAFLLIAFTDNPITYNLCYMDPVFALMGAAYTVTREEELDTDSRSGAAAGLRDRAFSWQAGGSMQRGRTITHSVAAATRVDTRLGD